MDRYGYLAAKNRAGEYDQWISEGFQDYFSRIGISNATLTIPKFQGLMNQYVALSESDKLKTTDQPIAWRYAPIYPSKLAGMPRGIKPFGAICMSAPENRNADEFKGRETSQSLIDEIQRGSQYSHLVIISQEDMLTNADGYTYLDHLFGAPLTKWQDLRRQRMGIHNLSLESNPSKVDPDTIEEYMHILSSAVASDLFSDEEDNENKKEHLILIRTEKNENFNDRSKELLKAIYAILPPQMAFEIGFASYQDLNTVPELTRCLNIRIFVVPGDYDITGKTAYFHSVYDLAEGFNKEQIIKDKKEDPLFQMLQASWGFSWNERQIVYSILFQKDDNEFHLKKHFIDQFTKLKNSPELRKKIHEITQKTKNVSGFSFDVANRLMQYEAENKELAMEKDKLSKQVIKLENDLKIADDNLKSVNNTAISRKGKVKQLEEIIRDKEESYSSLSAELEQKKDENSKLHKENDDLKKEMSKLKEKLAGTAAQTINKDINSEATSEQIITYSDGTKYVGYTAGGEPNGKGIMIWSDGDIYKGDFVNGKGHGQGEMRWSDGRVYIGNWVNDSRTGEGTITFPNGDKYEGEFKDGEYDGTGRLTHADGTVEEGDFSNGKYIGSKNKNIIESDGANKTHNSEEKEFKAISDSTLPVEQNSFAQSNDTSGDDASASTHNSTGGGNTGSEENNKLKYNEQEGKYRRTIVPSNKIKKVNSD